MALANREAIGFPRKKENQGVITNVTITTKGIPIGENTSYQIHPRPGSIIKGLGWMNYDEK